MIEDLGLAEPHMAEAVPNMGVDQVWNDFGFDGTGSVIAVLDTGVRGDHEGLNDMDDEPFTTGCEQPNPDPLDPNPIFVDCDPKVLNLRFSETRRKHPFAPRETIQDGIAHEIELLIPIKAKADLLIDTSDLTPHELRAQIKHHFDGGKNTDLAVILKS